MKLRIFITILLFTKVCLAQDSLKVSQFKTRIISFSFSPIKKEKVNGFSLSLINIPEEHSQIFNGINIELLEAGWTTPFVFLDNSNYIENTKTNHTINGFSLGPTLFNGNANGLMISLINTSYSFNGIKCGLVNVSFYKSKGLQLGILNFNLEEFNVVSIGLYNQSSVFFGLEIGLINKVEILNGVQIGIVNKTKSLAGLQIGIFNKSLNKAFQIGVWNKNKKRSFPLINW